MDTEDVIEKVEGLKEDSDERNFLQTVDLIVNLYDIDLSDPENRFSTDIILPHGRGKDVQVCVIADSKTTEAKKLDVNLITKDDLEDLEGNMDEAKKIAEENDIFLGEAPLMPKIGEVMGPVLGPRGKMPSPFKPGDNLGEILKKRRNSLNVKVGENRTLHFPVATEEMPADKIEENVRAVMDEIEGNLPKGPKQIGSAYLKLTMSSPVRLI
ncbi:MAG: 50S ribosomal protein L1 [Candidatus Aenigmatarchaeota archaeon]